MTFMLGQPGSLAQPDKFTLLILREYEELAKSEITFSFAILREIFTFLFSECSIIVFKEFRLLELLRFDDQFLLMKGF